MQQDVSFYVFGSFRLNLTERILERGDELVPLTPKVFDTLLILIQKRGHIVSKNELMELLWPDSFVEENSLTQNISLLRKALADFGDKVQYIETVPKRGYRFTANVVELTPSDSNLIQQEGKEHTTASKIDKFISTTQIPKWLKWSVTITTLLILMIGMFYFSYRRRPISVIGQVRSMAILPFQTIGPAEQDGDDKFGLAVADALIMRLGRLDHPRVLPTGSILKYTSRNNDSASIGNELGVDAVLDGTLQRHDDRVRVSVQLIRSNDAKVLWSRVFDLRQSQAFTLQDSLADLVANSLQPEIRGRTSHVLSRPTADQEAYEAYLTGVVLWKLRTRENLDRAIPYFEAAIKKDSKFALAHALLADCYLLRGDIGVFGALANKELLVQARQQAGRALKLNDGLAEAHTVMAGLALMDNDISTADQEFQRALELDPNYAVARLRYGYLLFYQQRLYEANTQMSRAREVDPGSPVTNAAHGFVLFMSRDYESSIVAFRKALELQPDLVAARFDLGVTYAAKGMFREAVREFEKIEPHDPLSAAKGKVWAYGLGGQSDDARRIMSILERSNEKRGLTQLDYVYLYSCLSENDKAFAWLEKVELDPVVIARLKFDPVLDPLRADVRFAQYLSRHQQEVLAQRKTPG